MLFRSGGNGGATTLIANSTITGNTDMHDAVKFFGTTSAAIDQSTITGNSGTEVVVQSSVTLAIDGSVVEHLAQDNPAEDWLGD